MTFCASENHTPAARVFVYEIGEKSKVPAGRPKKTVEHHRKAGNYRPSRHGKLKIPVAAPPKPRGLSRIASATWNAITKELIKQGTIGTIDGKALRMLCESWDVYCSATDDIRKHGVVIDKPSQWGYVRAENPAVRVRAKAFAEVMKGLAKFGMTPSDRNGLNEGDRSGGETEEEHVASVLKITG